MEKINGRAGCEPRSGLQSQDTQRMFWSPPQPLDRKEQHDRHLPCHQELKDVRRGSFVGVADNGFAMGKTDCKAGKHDRQRDD